MVGEGRSLVLLGRGYGGLCRALSSLVWWVKGDGVWCPLLFVGVEILTKYILSIMLV